MEHQKQKILCRCESCEAINQLSRTFLVKTAGDLLEANVPAANIFYTLGTVTEWMKDELIKEGYLKEDLEDLMVLAKQNKEKEADEKS